MSDGHETIADLIAWLRKPREGENAYLTLWRDEIADRLEAAWKRDTKELRVEIERLKEERNYSGVRERERLRAKGFAIVPKEQLERGDAAKLREALNRLVIASEGFLKTHSAKYYVDTTEALDKAKAALAAPARNCDKYSHDQALRIWSAESENPMNGCFDVWLYAPAPEGGDNAD